MEKKILLFSPLSRRGKVLFRLFGKGPGPGVYLKEVETWIESEIMSAKVRASEPKDGTGRDWDPDGDENE
jgi:hypothetical protein